MAAIDLRSTSIFIKDGSVGTITGTVNHVGGYGIGTKTLAVTMTATPTPGMFLTFAGHLQFYTVIAATGTTSVSIYPGLFSPVATGDVIDIGGNAVYAKIGEGNLTYSEKRNLVYIRDRGLIDTVKLGDEEPMDVSMDFTWEFLRGGVGAAPTFEEAFKRIGAASNWVSTSTDPCEPYSVDIVLFDIPPCGTDAEKIVLPEFRWESVDHDIKGAKIATKGTCNVLQAIITHTTP